MKTLLKTTIKITMLILICNCLNGCAKTETVKDFSPKRLFEFAERGDFPERVIYTDGIWNVERINYKGHSISVGSDIENTEVIYENDAGYRNRITANGRCIAWAEWGIGEIQDEVHLKIYDKKTNEIKNYYTLPGDGSMEDGRQYGKVWLFDNLIYFYIRDYKKNVVEYYRYNIDSEEIELFDKATITYYTDELMNVSGESLLYFKNPIDGKGVICNLNINTGEAKDIILPQKVDELFSVVYDKANNSYIIYYGDSEANKYKIGRFHNKDKEIEELHTMSRESWVWEEVYDSELSVHNHYVLWVQKQYTVPRYALMAMNMDTKELYMFEGGFSFGIAGDDIYCLTRDGDWYPGLYKLNIEG